MTGLASQRSPFPHPTSSSRSDSGLLEHHEDLHAQPPRLRLFPIHGTFFDWSHPVQVSMRFRTRPRVLRADVHE